MSTLLFANIVNVQCGECGVIFGLEKAYQERKREDHSTFYCPNGHPRYYVGKTEQEKEIERLQREVREVTASRDYHRTYAERKRKEAETARRSAAANRGVVTKVKRRLSKGVCPCCNRYFKELHQHMETQHPEWREESEA